MKPEIKVLHAKALEAASRFKRAEADLIDILQEADRTRVYFHMSYKSLFEYVVGALGLSESIAYNLITVSRKAREVPALQTAIRSGGLTVSKARKVTAVLNRANSDEWIQKAMTLSSRKLEAAVADATQPGRERSIGLHLGLPRPVYENLKRAQELECQRQGRSVSLEQALEAALGIYLEKQDPVKRAERILEKKKSASQPTQSVSALVTGQVQPSDPSASPVGARARSIPAAFRHRAHARDQGRCTYVDPRTSLRCEERKWVHLHHVQPKARGGTHAPENLTTLCSSHHRWVHHRGDS